MKRILAPAVVLLAALTLGGCSSFSGSSGGDASDGAAEPGVGVPVAPDLGGGGGESGGDAGSEDGGDSEADADRSVVTTGSMEITAADPLAAAAEATRIVERLGGRVD